MPQTILTHSDDLSALDSELTYWVYNGLDCALTKEIHEKLLPQLDDNTSLIYGFERAMCAPALEMMLNGLKVDDFARRKMMSRMIDQRDRVQSILDRIASAVWGKGLNPNSPPQMKEFLYEALDLPEQFKFDKGQRKVATDREAIEKLLIYFHARPILRCILKIRDLAKKISVLQTGIDSDGRMRASFNPSSTETGRWSSSSNVFGGGTNMQNITEGLRHIFVASPGKKLAYIDLEQAESRAVGLLVWNLFGDPSYLDACESGDLHTTVCKMAWTDLDWPGDPKGDRAIADQVFYRHFSYRDMAKRGGHGTNYRGSAKTMARHLKVDRKIMDSFQERYFEAFPGIPRWHTWVAEQVQTEGFITTALGRKRHFFGRGNDDATVREAIAFEPQSIVGDLLNLGLWRLWDWNIVDLVGQVHDAILFEYDAEREDEILPAVQEAVEVPVTLAGRTMKIPTELKVGWNWGPGGAPNYLGLHNPHGLEKWSGPGSDERSAPSDSLLSRRLF